MSRDADAEIARLALRVKELEADAAQHVEWAKGMIAEVARLQNVEQENERLRAEVAACDGHGYLREEIERLRAALDRITALYRRLTESDYCTVERMAEIVRLRQAAMEVVESIPATYDETHPSVKRHAAALIALSAALAQPEAAPESKR